MAKYSEEFKIKLVTEYLNGNIAYKPLASKYNMPSETPLINWVRAYKTQGIEGLKRRKTNEVYSVQFKLNNPSLINRWMKGFNEQGVEGLKPKLKGRPSMSKKPSKQTKKEEKKLTREAELERENELLRLEIAYLKKLRAFRENPNVFHEKHKQKWHSNSKKKDMD